MAGVKIPRRSVAAEVATILDSPEVAALVHGPERQAYSDPDASWGHRSAVSTRKGGGFYGYRRCLRPDGPAARVGSRDGTPERIALRRPIA